MICEHNKFACKQWNNISQKCVFPSGNSSKQYQAIYMLHLIAVRSNFLKVREFFLDRQTKLIINCINLKLIDFWKKM